MTEWLKRFKFQKEIQIDFRYKIETYSTIHVNNNNNNNIRKEFV